MELQKHIDMIIINILCGVYIILEICSLLLLLIISVRKLNKC